CDQAVLNVILQVIGKSIGEIFEVALHVFFWLTLVFAILERTDKNKDTEPSTLTLQKLQTWRLLFSSEYAKCFSNHLASTFLNLSSTARY
ncbi:hypothetical protein ACT453_50240, partial [Bacillus sp. D-CC]